MPVDAKNKQKVVHHDKLKLHEGEQSLPWAKSAHKAYKPKTKLGSPAWRTKETECDLADQPSVTNNPSQWA